MPTAPLQQRQERLLKNGNREKVYIKAGKPREDWWTDLLLACQGCNSRQGAMDYHRFKAKLAKEAA